MNDFLHFKMFIYISRDKMNRKRLFVKNGKGMYPGGIVYDEIQIMPDLIKLFNSFVEYSNNTQAFVNAKKSYKLSYTDLKLNKSRGVMVGFMKAELIDNLNNNKLTLKLCSLSGDKIFEFLTDQIDFGEIKFINNGFKNGTLVFNIKKKCYTKKKYKKSCAAIKLQIALAEYLKANKLLSVYTIYIRETWFRKIHLKTNSFDYFSTKLDSENFYNRLERSCKKCEETLYYTIND